MKKYKLLIILILVVVVLGGVGFFVKKRFIHKKVETPKVSQDVKYVDFVGNYLFSIPNEYFVDSMSLPGADLLYKGDKIEGKNLEDLYKQGVVIVRSLGGSDNLSEDAFYKYVNDMIVGDLKKTYTNSAIDFRKAPDGTIAAAKVFALDVAGKRLHSIYAVNYVKPVILDSLEESDALKVAGGTIEQYDKSASKSGVDPGVVVIKNVLEMAKKNNVNGIIRVGSADLKKGLSKKELGDKLGDASKFFVGSVDVVGATFDGENLVAQVLFEDKGAEKKFVGGNVVLKKYKNDWKLEGMVLPSSKK